MNDTVGQLSAAGFMHGQECIIGVVIGKLIFLQKYFKRLKMMSFFLSFLGYGCNAAYLEDVSNIKKFDPVKNNYSFPKVRKLLPWFFFLLKNGDLDDR